MDDRVAHYLQIVDLYRELGQIDEATYRNVKTWLTNPDYEEFLNGVIDLIKPTPLIDAFYQIIPFGTGGRRGMVGVGSNRMNTRTLGESAQGVASYIKSRDRDGSLAKRGVVIARDVRLSSPEFEKITAEVFAANGIKVFLFRAPRSTPLLSFAVRYLKTIAGVVVTASHNPPSDNGFKAYWEDGGQVVAPHDTAILEMVKNVDGIVRMDIEEAKGAGLVEILDDRVDTAYFEMLCRDVAYCDEREATIVYSPLHGTGVTIVPELLERFGFTDVHMPPEQVEMDGRFPTVPKNYPNPEQPAAMTAAVALAKEVGADVVLASDPDGDRVGVYVPAGDGEYVYLTGNEFQTIMLDFVLSRLKAQGRLPEKAYVCTTQVTTKLLRKIAKSHGVEIVDDLLVGFKNIAFEMLRREELGVATSNMVFACEESIGYMIHHEIRDKDSGAASAMAAQMTAYYKAHGKTLLERLHELYAEHGYIYNKGFAVFLHGEAGAAQMRGIMDALRSDPPREIAGLPVVRILDRQEDTELDVASGEKRTLGLPQSNVLVYELVTPGGFDSVAIRPSGTEPKIKHYISTYGPGTKRHEVVNQGEALETAVRQIEQDILDRQGQD